MLVAVSIGLIAVLIPLNLFLVTLKWGSFPWLFEAVEYALYVGVFIGAPWVLRQGAHIRVDVVTAALPEGPPPLGSRRCSTSPGCCSACCSASTGCA